MELVLAAPFIHDWPNYLPVRIQTEIEHNFLHDAYVVKVHAYELKDLQFASLHHHGDMIASVQCDLEVIRPKPGDCWEVPVTYVDAKLKLYVSEIAEPPAVITILDADLVVHDRVRLQLNNIRIVKKKHQMHISATRVADAPLVTAASVPMAF